MMNLVTISERENGRLCPYCRAALVGGTTGAKCGACSAIHHEDCWSEGGGCAVFGCTGAAGASEVTPPPIPPLGKAAAAMSDGAIVIKGKPQHPPAQEPLPSNDQNSRTKTLLMIAAIPVAAVVAVLIAVFAFSDPSPTGVVPEPTTTPSSASDDSSDTPSETDRVASRRVLKVLDDYTSAYSNEDMGGLSRIFTPNIQRWGVNGAKSCAHDTGRRAVLDAYETQFVKNPASTYSFTPLRSFDVDRISETRARVETNYSIGTGSSYGAIKFSFERSDSAGWRISRVKVGNCV